MKRTLGIALLVALAATVFFLYRIHPQTEPQPSAMHDSGLKMTREQASRFARLALKNLQREYPSKLDHVINDAHDLESPRRLHPAFYGSFDWHSCVHGHWMLVRLLRQYPDLPEQAEIRAILDENLSVKNLEAEAAYFHQPHRQSFERTYGWAWLLKLAQELHESNHPDAARWSRNLEPLTEVVVARYLAFLPKQTYPIRTGVHPNTAFGLAFAHDYAVSVGHQPLRQLVEERARAYYLRDVDYPAAWEPGGEDFFSASLMEADLMRRVLPASAFQSWFARFLPKLGASHPPALLDPATVADRSDPKIVHLDGLNLSRAWCMMQIARVLPESDRTRAVLEDSARRHAHAALDHVASGDYAGEHWLASFAVYLYSAAE